ncbi:GH92 family glycosyl hydrolase [Flavihumibacter rivuli]|uniref:GH92 family glycosyl hydrolase n=1 Tax=Flavihumibacter rivuli TaxID=2838156 RepID=UPI001BDE2F0F|nr:GH92 family glycosyl hydrolase [Flavihumibacter rivuli]ULQ55779.1 GH92 family glycosyl hydrolase [Flavihumibacter rivuli]
MKKIILAIAHIFLVAGADAQKLVSFVDPFLGTGGHGHVFPGATVPFGMVQLSPDNGDQGWDWCSGYHYSSHTIAGFSHTHLSGTGIGDWCDISVLPLTDTASIHSKKILVPFSHANEKASPGYYEVKLDNGVKASLTATDRIGYHRYQFPGQEGWLRFDMGFAINWDSATMGGLQLLDDCTLIGYRYSTGWAKNQKVYFAARFSRSISSHRILMASGQEGKFSTGNQVKSLLQFNTQGQPLECRVALSSVGTEAALAELQAVTAGFEETVKAAEGRWEKELEKIRINTDNKDFATRFYTALYRTCMAPNLYSDRDGRYHNSNGLIKKQPKGDKYTVFSLWDTFRALNPLFTITQTERLPDLVNSMLSFYQDNGLLPVWDLSSWETNTMTGYHALPVLADAILKGIGGFDVNLAYEAMYKSAHQQQRGTPAYIRYGYLPQDKHGWSVTITLEYAFDDWCIAQVAKKIGKQADYEYFMKRAGSYKNLFDPASGFMRGKDSLGKFIEPFDPLLSEHGFEGQYIEGTAWQHSFFVPHDVEGLAVLYGGKEKLVKKLDELFSSSSELHGENVSADVSGLIGQYAHGNEPSHHIIYLYTKLGHPEKAAEKIRIVVDSMYKSGPDGLSGNDDCGQMSAWLVWTSLGMYPLNPASGEYVFGYPLVNSADIFLPNGKTLTIRVKKAKDRRKTGIQSVRFNGRELPSLSIRHADIMQGGNLEFLISTN